MFIDSLRTFKDNNLLLRFNRTLKNWNPQQKNSSFPVGIVVYYDKKSQEKFVIPKKRKIFQSSIMENSYYV